MTELDLVWETLYVVEVEMIIHHVHILNCFRELSVALVPIGTSDISLAKCVKFMLRR